MKRQICYSCVCSLLGACFLLLVGCARPNTDAARAERNRYIAFCRELAVAPIEEDADSDDFMSKPDWMVHPCSATDREFRKEYKVVYANREYLSFFCSEYAYTGGAHGNIQITVGTLDRRTGKILTLADVPAFADKVALAKRLSDAVIAKIGLGALQGEVRPHDNFYLSGDGWHFVFNEYEIACYARGAVEVVLPR